MKANKTNAKKFDLKTFEVAKLKNLKGVFGGDGGDNTITITDGTLTQNPKTNKPTQPKPAEPTIPYL